MRNVAGKGVDEIKARISCSKAFSKNSVMEKHGRSRHATDDNIIRHTRFACWITKATGRRPDY